MLSSTHFRSTKGKRSPDHPRSSHHERRTFGKAFAFSALLLLLLLQLLLPKLHCAELLPLLLPLLLLRLPHSLPSSVQIFVMAAVTACSLSKSTALFVAASSFSSSKQPVSRPFVVAVKTSSSFSLQERRLCRFSSSSSSQGFVVPSVSSSLNHSCLSRKAPSPGFFLLVVLGLLHLFVESFWIVFEKLLHLKGRTWRCFSNQLCVGLCPFRSGGAY